MKTDPYAYWRAKLAGLDPDPPEDRTQLPCGRWRLRDGRPMAVWLDADGIRRAAFGLGAHPLTNERMEAMAESGSFGTAVTVEQYGSAMETGRWHDEPPPVKTAHTADGEARPNANADDPAEALRIELEGEIETTAAFFAKPIASEDDANMAAAWAKRLVSLSSRAVEAHKAEKKPWLIGCHAVDAEWFPIRDGAKELADKLRKHLEPWLKAKQRADDEARAKAAEEAARLTREAEIASRSPDDEAARRRAKELAEQAAKAKKAADAPAKATAGRSGARVSLRKETRAVIVDYAACYAALASHPDMRAFVQTLADRACRAKVPLAGVEYREEEVAR